MTDSETATNQGSSPAKSDKPGPDKPGTDKPGTDKPGTDYRESVFLPRTGFPMRGDLPRREPQILERWQTMRLDARIAQAASGRRRFTLHDGPPYANGHLHIGHALNKILKDVINRAHRSAGFAVHYVPGWDCHGLPIEWRIEEEYRKSGRDKDQVPILQFRAECRAYAQKWLEVQSEEFRRLGVQGDWAGRYATMDFASEAVIACEIGRFLLNGSLYRGLRPVLWSPVEKTALADAEIEYHDLVSQTVWVGFPVVRDATPGGMLQEAEAVIWTTTPWTMPGNRAIAYGAEIDYAVIAVGAVAEGSSSVPGRRLLVAAALADDLAAAAGITDYLVLHRLPGAALEGSVCGHPWRGQGYEFTVPLLAGDFVTTEQGSGLVHMAPGHGEDDFALTASHGIAVPETVLDDGRYAASVPLFAGIHVFKAAAPVSEALAASGALLARGTLTHSYPHSWRSRAPVIWRATPQWFIRMDGQTQIRARALAALDDVRFVPSQARRRLTAMVAGRPDWCISRQRAWGVPIAVFVEKATGAVLRDPEVMARIVSAFRTEGADVWYSAPASRFLGPGRDPDAYEQVRDIVDVWFESGSTHAFVLGGPDLPFPADLYLEGSDQHRGWFQSSLLESVGARGQAPFRALVTNGFVLDEHGRKMSKSLGNVVSPQQVNDTLGADILRLWVMNSDTNEDLRLGGEILKQQGELYRRLRNTLRWLLGALDGFTEDERVEFATMPELERWVLHRVAELDAQVRHAVASHEWVGLLPAIHGFCASDLSAFYFDIRKDALYCDAAGTARRRAARTVLDVLHRCLCTWLAPVLCFTAEEAWTARFGEQDSVHLQLFPQIPSGWLDPLLAERWLRLRAVRRLITSQIEAARREGVVGSSLQAEVELSLSEREAGLLAGTDWEELAIVSRVVLLVQPGAASVFVEPLPGDSGTAHQAPQVRAARGRKCARCWRVLEEVGSRPAHPDLCRRCDDVLACDGAGTDVPEAGR